MWHLFNTIIWYERDVNCIEANNFKKTHIEKHNPMFQTISKYFFSNEVIWKFELFFFSFTRFEESDWTAGVDDGEVVVVGGHNVVIRTARSNWNKKIW